MALDITSDQAVKDFINSKYTEFLGGNAASEGQKYWGDQIKAGTLKAEDLGGHLSWSHEGQQYADRKKQDTAAGIDTTERWVGGVNPNLSLNAQIDANAFNDKSYTYDRPAWIGKYDAGIDGERAQQSLMGDLQALNNDVGLNRTYTGYDSNTTKNAIENTIKDQTGGGGDDGSATADGWWNQFADADAFKDFLNGGQQSGGMDDFMKFMMLMSVMGGGRGMGGGGGYGGSQYGYGGLNPGGVQAAYNPWDNMTKGWDFMKNAFGSGSGDVTADNLNVTGTT